MILYNVTVNIDKEVENEWLQWMKQIHIPNVLKTGMFVDHKMYKIMADDPQGTSYSIQYFADSMEKLNKYQSEFASALQAETIQNYGRHLVAFRTVLESVD
ncbi:DUF4286 family protein [Reichenbachiella sp. MALMAid0571]|uniref:DUF4286 family protein n=1 Tax=Reichenbachiella sp. MALMAid0571 TaxID=3143939 RepID=UPI0032DFCD60